MGKLNTANWIERFETLSPESQLEVANAIERELRFNNGCPSDDDHYDDVKGKELEEKFAGKKGEIRNILVSKIKNIELETKINKINELIGRFKNLDEKHQNILLDKMLEPFEDVLKIIEERQGYEICLKEGRHDWDKWQEGTRDEEYTWYPPDITDHDCPDYGKTSWIEIPIWVRKCKRCGKEETRNYKDVPDEIKEEREKEAAEKREKKRLKDIAKKEKQLVKIQQEINDLKGNKK